MDLCRFYLEKTCLIDISKLILNKFSENIHDENITANVYFISL
jgi:hypothetical protein